MSEEIENITEELVESKKHSLKARFKIIKNLPEEVANTQIENDNELSKYIRDVLQLNFHNAFAMYGVLVMDEPENFKITKSDIKNKKFKFEYNGTLYASLKLLNMLTSYNKEIKEKETDIMNMIEDYYVISYNIPFNFNSSGKITKENSLVENVRIWINHSESPSMKMSSKDEEILNVLDKYSVLAIEHLVSSIDKQINDELISLIGE